MSCSGENESEIIASLIEAELVSEDAAYFSSGEFDNAIIGVTEDGRFVYDYWKMVEFLLDTGSESIEDAMDFLDSSTIRFLPLMGKKPPVIMYRLEDLPV